MILDFNPRMAGAIQLDADGVRFRLLLRAEGPEGIIGDGEVTVGPRDPDYRAVAAEWERRHAEDARDD